MPRVHLEAAEDHVHRLAHERDPIGAVRELILNSLDANAQEVIVTIERSAMAGIEKVTVTDDGTGIPAESCRSAFDRIGGSWKQPSSTTEKYGRPLQGHTGQGRLRGYALGSQIRWTTVAD